MLSLRQPGTMLNTQICGTADSVQINRVSSPGQATTHSVVFAEDKAALEAAIRSDAAGVILSAALGGLVAGGKALPIAERPRLAFARAAQLLQPPEPCAGIYPTAVTEAGVILGEHVRAGRSCWF
jgi:UDP-3-O-[3-hydroxymyristoyl] glucosamine N-acyltransferase